MKACAISSLDRVLRFLNSFTPGEPTRSTDEPIKFAGKLALHHLSPYSRAAKGRLAERAGRTALVCTPSTTR